MAKNAENESPLMKQHAEMKRKFPDAMLLFRVGDFYETFGEEHRIRPGYTNLCFAELVTEFQTCGEVGSGDGEDGGVVFGTGGDGNLRVDVGVT